MAKRKKQVRIMEMDREQLKRLIERREKQVRFAKGLLATFDIAEYSSKED